MRIPRVTTVSVRLAPREMNIQISQVTPKESSDANPLTVDLVKPGRASLAYENRVHKTGAIAANSYIG
jgi:hypothetical protein